MPFSRGAVPRTMGTMNNYVVVGAFGSATSRSAVRWAASYAASQATSLVLVHAGVSPELSTGDDAGRGRASSARARARSTLATSRVIAHAAAGASLPVETVLTPAPPDEALTDWGKNACMIVVGSRRRGGFARAVLGSVSNVVATHALCPVAVVPAPHPVRPPSSDTGTDAPPAPVVVGIDFSSDTDDSVLAVAFAQAARLGVGLHAVHAYTPPDSSPALSGYIQFGPQRGPSASAQRWLDSILAPWSHKYPAVEITTAVVDDYPSHAILADATHAQLIVVGSRSRGAISPLFTGSASRAVLHHAAIPTIIVPSITRPTDIATEQQSTDQRSSG